MWFLEINVYCYVFLERKKKSELDKCVGVNRSWPELVALISISYQQRVQLDLRIQFACWHILSERDTGLWRII